MTTKTKIRPWLLWTGITVLVLGLAYMGWNRYQVNGYKGTATTSPTSTKTLALSPSAGTTTSPTTSTNKISTPSNNESNPTATPASNNSTPTPTSAIPAGWKNDSQTLRAHGTYSTGQYTMLVKDDWTINSPNSTNPELQQYALGNQSDCGSNWDWPGCAVVVTFKWASTTSESNVYWTTDHKGYFALTFPNNNLSESDKKIVTDSFSAGGTSQQ